MEKKKTIERVLENQKRENLETICDKDGNVFGDCMEQPELKGINYYMFCLHYTMQDDRHIPALIQMRMHTLN